ncbi:serine hydrolase [Emticicia sp. C21]|uniref:serine hydrolase domain-containing protein n=1 Tax=Emticicia sp. C21 TaxID=2302915 RepID=UPI000E34DE75|nr:serine hydrolase domain-containing protein [Emticicia sp. C21]RFS18452.1 class A beta-lactamase-related serine hydrolase [Emticicia sp. C21]
MLNFTSSIITLLFYLLSAAIPCASQANITSEIVADIELLLKEYDRKNKPGLTVGIIKDGNLVFQQGYGMANIAKKIPNAPDVSYEIASVSKQFTAAAIVSLIQKKQLSFEDDIHKYLPDFPDYGKSITIYHLLYHTSGIRDYMVLMWLTGRSFEAAFTNKEALEIIKQQSSLNFQPGQRCVYSNSNYILLAEVVHKVSGLSLSKYAEKELFGKLGMKQTSIEESKPASVSLLAYSYGKNEKGYFAYKNGHRTMGDEGAVTNLKDIAIWDNTFYDKNSISFSLLNRGKLENGNLLSYGMGIMTGSYKGEPIHTHPGAYLGYRAEILRFPRKHISIIVLGNSGEINPETISRRVADVYVFNDKSSLVNEVPVKKSGVENYCAIMGKYEVAPNVLIDIQYKGGVLSGQITGQPMLILTPDTENSYNVSNGDKVIFDNKVGGLMQQLTVVQKQGKTTATRLATVTPDLFKKYVGEYESAEQKAIYTFYADKNALWFKVGTNAPEKAEILKKYNRLQFSYQNLESATMVFEANSAGEIEGFTLSSGRINGLKFVKKK